ncbi:DUF4190 domain-containing protein [Mumia sp. zg.B53]|uniref:DUF4190 domain-containing protein n=1 Tax=unclassified Mumia TaxID=2621872 RepID=UPI001C6E2043|nr:MULTISPECIES: DUF4190 domain-containing protein [unclassified Mumia]MBW9211504.1 DUF4190 domain-containing protein [Mumia sp. zg.B21]MBW9216677.1 DUF4190 domain-containing protein [Mumia sp. zg.B53]
MSYPPPGGPTPPDNDPPRYDPSQGGYGDQPPGGYGNQPPGGYGDQPPGGYGYTPQGDGPYGEPPKNSPKAIWALVTGILGLCCGPLGIVGIILGRSAKAEIDASNGRLTGGGLAQAGLIIGIIAVVLWVLTVLVRFVFSAGN